MRFLYQRLDGTVRMKTFFFLKWGTHPRISQLIRRDCSVFVTRSHLIQESRVSMAQKFRSGYRYRITGSEVPLDKHVAYIKMSSGDYFLHMAPIIFLKFILYVLKIKRLKLYLYTICQRRNKNSFLYKELRLYCW